MNVPFGEHLTLTSIRITIDTRNTVSTIIDFCFAFRDLVSVRTESKVFAHLKTVLTKYLLLIR